MEIKNNNSDIAKKYLEIAEKDLEVSKFLYDKGYYPISIYHLQQSIEKLVKYYLLKIGMNMERFKEYKEYLHSHTPIDAHVLKGIIMLFFGYKYQNMVVGSIGAAYFLNIRKDQNFDNKFLPWCDPIERFREFISDRLNDENFNKLKDTSKEILSPFHDVEYKMYKSLDINVDDDETILKIGKKEILDKLFPLTSFTSLPKLKDYYRYAEMLKLCDTLVTNERIKAYIDECFFEVYEKKRDEYLKDCYTELQKSKKSKSNNLQVIFENMMRDISIHFANRDDSIMKIMWLSMITGPHEACTRYPGGILDPNDYKHGLGVIDAYLDIHKVLKEYIECKKSILYNE